MVRGSRPDLDFQWLLLQHSFCPCVFTTDTHNMCMHFYTRYSQYSSSLSDLIGHVQGLSDLLTSKDSGNKYFQVRLKTSEKNIDIVKFMKKQNPTIKLQLFKEKMDASQPIKLSNLTEVNTGAIFFNSN